MTSTFEDTYGFFIHGFNKAEAIAKQIFKGTVPRDQMPDWKELDDRTFGWYSKENEDLARLNIINNACDIHETNYEYVVLEKVYTGVYPHSEIVQFYQWDAETGKYKEIPRPEWSKGVCNWSLG